MIIIKIEDANYSAFICMCMRLDYTCMCLDHTYICLDYMCICLDYKCICLDYKCQRELSTIVLKRVDKGQGLSNITLEFSDDLKTWTNLVVLDASDSELDVNILTVIIHSSIQI